MSATLVGLFVGLVLGLAVAFGGLFGLVMTALLGAAGFVVGRAVDGELDLNALVGRGRDR